MYFFNFIFSIRLNVIESPPAPKCSSHCLLCFPAGDTALMHILRLADESPDTGGHGDRACPLACATENQYGLLFRSAAEMPVYLQHF